jgi:predicted nuclease of predicted toxin-antitoxin system
MRLLLDECCSARLVAALRASGHDVLYVREAEPGVSDDRVVGVARETDRIIVTEDFGFGERAIRHREPMPGLIMLVFGGEPMMDQIRIVLTQLAHGQEAHLGRLTTIEPARVRTRLLLP